MHQQAVGLVA